MNKSKYRVIIILLFCSNCLLAQSVPAWGGGADQKDLSFGFSFSYVNSYYKIDKKPDWRTPFLDPQNNNQPVTSMLNSIGSQNSLGFAVGFITRYRLTEHLEVRVAPSLVFADRVLNYTYVATPDIDKTVSATVVDFPLSMKLKSDRVGNLRAYILGGVKYSQALSDKRSADENSAAIDKLAKNIGNYPSYEAGLGCDIYFEFFKMSPEIKLSNSFGNILLHENNAFSKPLDKLSLHTLMFSLYFE